MCVKVSDKRDGGLEGEVGRDSIQITAVKEWTKRDQDEDEVSKINQMTRRRRRRGGCRGGWNEQRRVKK